MVNIIVTDLQGDTQQLQAEEGTQLMELLRQHDYEGIDGICGGSCSCATCHVHIANDWQNKLPERSEDETMLVECVDSYSPEASRLSCQLMVTAELEGLTLTVAEA